MKGCNVCKEKIQDKARICIHCKNDQSFIRRSIKSTQLTVAAVITIISLFTISSPILERQLRLERPKLQFYIVQFSRASQNDLILGTRNTGSADGLLTSVQLNCPTSNWQSSLVLPAGESPVIPAYSSKTVTYQVDFEKMSRQVPLRSACSVDIEHDFLNPGEHVTLALPELNN